MNVITVEKNRVNKITPNQVVTVVYMNNGTVEIEHLANKSSGLNGIKKMSKSSCVNTETGEVFDFIPSENRAQSSESARKSYKKLRRLINNNFYGNASELFITLTYGVQFMLLKKGWITKRQKARAKMNYILHGKKKNKTIGEICVARKYITQEQLDTVYAEMRDAKIFYDNFRKFMGRFRTKYESDCGRIEFICVKEPQGSKNHYAWHAHLLIKFMDLRRAPFIDNEDVLQPMWGFGLTKCQSLKDINKAASYVSSHFDLPVDEVDEDFIKDVPPDLIVEKEITNLEGNAEIKQVIKCGRLSLYPSGVKIYSSSNGMIPPEIRKMRFKTALKTVRGKMRTYSKTIEIIDEDTGICLNKYTVKQYQNKKKSKRYNYSKCK